MSTTTYQTTRHTTVTRDFDPDPVPPHPAKIELIGEGRTVIIDGYAPRAMGEAIVRLVEAAYPAPKRPVGRPRKSI